MQTVNNAIATALRTTHSPRARLLILNGIDDLSVARTFDEADGVLVGGDVSLDRTRQVRGTSTLLLANETGVLSPTAFGDSFYGRSLVRIQRGIVLASGTTGWVTLATHVVDRPRSSMNGQLSVSCNDRLWLAQQPFGEPSTLDVGMRVGDAIHAWLDPVVGADAALWNVDDGGQELGVPVIVSEDDDRLDRATSLANDHALELLTDRQGRVVLRPRADPTTAASVLTIESGVSMLDHERELRAMPVNRAHAIGEPLTGIVYRGVAEVTDTSSPLHRDRIGLVTAPPYRSAAIATQFQADAVAYQRLLELALVDSETVTRILPDPRIDEGDVVTLSESVTSTSGKHRIDRVVHPITMGDTSIVATRTQGLL